MAVVDSPLLIAVAVVLGLLLTVGVGMGRMLRALRPTPCYANKSRRSQWKGQGQQLEARQLLDGALAGEALALEGESITVGGVTYDNVDMIALAKAIKASGAKFYGADWCPFCTQQKELFGEGADELPFFEVTNKNHTLNQLGIEQDITQLPTWTFDNGETRYTGVLQIDELIAYTGVTIPQGEDLYFEEIPDQTDLISGQSYHIPLDGYSPSGQPLTYTVTSASGNITATVMQGNKSLRIFTSRYGTMEFYLFEEEAFRATNRIIELAESGFYDGIRFHRVYSNFVIQGGDPTGTGTQGSSLPDFEDQFDPDLRHNGTGILSYAKSFDDTNDSQFFIMEGTAAHLDFQHTVFGFLTEGEKIREAISETYKIGTTPQWNVVMDEVTTFIDMENGVLRLKIPEGATGSDTITVTVSDGQGHTLSQSFNVTYAPDENYDSNPYLSFIPDVTMTPGSTTTFRLTAQDWEGDGIVYHDESYFPKDNDEPSEILPYYAPAGIVYSVDSVTGELVIETAPSLSPGMYKIMVAASNDLGGEIIPGLIDYDVINIIVGQRPVLGLDIVNVDEDESVTFNPLDNDTSSTGSLDPSSLFLVSQPPVGQLTIDPSTGEMQYTPPADYFGEVSFQYNVANQYGIIGMATTISIVVAPVNDPPEAVDDIFVADRDAATLLSVLRNDNRGGLLEADSAVSVTLPSGTTAAGGSVTVVGNQVQYTPPASFTGTDTFSYTLYDFGLESTVTVTVEVPDTTNFMITATGDVTETGGDGIVDDRPQSEGFLGEWDSFWVEVWGSADGTGGDTITAAAATLNYDPAIYQATSIVLDDNFTEAAGTGFNNGLGTATLNVTSSGVALAAGQRIRLGRIRFEPLANGLDAPELGGNLGVDFSTFLSSMTNVSMTVDGVGAVDSPTTDIDLPTRLIPMVYDLNDDGRVSVVDFSVYIHALGNRNSNAFIDFDLTGNYYGSSFGFFRSAVGATYSTADPTVAWSPRLIKAAMGDSILTSQINGSGIASSLTTEDVGMVTAALPATVVETSVNNDTNVVTIQIVDLSGSQIATTIGNTIYLDHDAAGWGWFVDSTPLDSSEYQADSQSDRLLASSVSPASGKIDLVSVLLHELGHVAGYEHAEGGLMSTTILPGERLIDWDNDAFEESFYISAVDQLLGNDED